jgi:hypothetical protein
MHFRPNVQRLGTISLRESNTCSVSKLPQFHIPVRSHVRQFLLKEFGPDPWAIHQNTFMGVTVKMKVQKQPFRQGLRLEPEAAQGAVLRLTLPTALKHHVLTGESCKSIGDMLNKFFQQQMFQFVQGQAAVTGNDRQALRCFYKLYDINPSDYDLEVARKAYRDYKDRIIGAEGHLMQLYQNPQTLFSDYAVAS